LRASSIDNESDNESDNDSTTHSHPPKTM